MIGSTAPKLLYSIVCAHLPAGLTILKSVCQSEAYNKIEEAMIIYSFSSRII
jgi:hypothetical protein